jgi:site-specific recombinase XerD
MTKQDVLNKLTQDTKLRGLSKHTQDEYYTKVKQFQDFYDKSATEMGIDEVRDYLLYLLEEKKLSSGSVNTYNSGLRFLYNNSLDMPLNISKIPRHKRSRKLPEILTRLELQAIFDACENLRDKCMLMTTYSAGLRVSEIVKLRVKNIDSEKMQIFIEQAKGNKDSFAILSKANLEILREYWLKYRPKEYLFYSRSRKVMTTRSFQAIFDKYVTKAGITKEVTAHSLRHAFATHLLEDGVSVFDIKQLLGHADLSTTCFYLRLVKISELNVSSPIDKFLGGNQ